MRELDSKASALFVAAVMVLLLGIYAQEVQAQPPPPRSSAPGGGRAPSGSGGQARGDGGGTRR